MDLELDGRTAVVTGGSKGIGLAIASALAGEGARVLVGARSTTDELRELTTRHDVRSVEVDLATPEGPQALLAQAAEQFGSVDLLINNVGASELAAGTLAFADEQWQRIFDVTLFSAVRTTRAAVPLMPEHAGAAIVTIASVNATLPVGAVAPYNAAKAALLNVNKGLSEELGPRGIRVNAISSGPVRTPMWTAPGGFGDLFAQQAGTTSADMMDRVLPEMLSITVGRVAEPREIADLALFLCSPRSSYVTGANYLIDGGMLKSVG